MAGNHFIIPEIQKKMKSIDIISFFSYKDKISEHFFNITSQNGEVVPSTKLSFRLPLIVFFFHVYSLNAQMIYHR